MNCPTGEELLSLRWRPGLPAGWTLASASGLGSPEIRGQDVVFTKSSRVNPLHFNLAIDVPPGQTGTKPVRGEIEFTMTGLANPETRPVRSLDGSDVLILDSQPSPAAVLSLDLASGRPVLTLRGVVGRAYAILQLPAFEVPQPLSRWLWFVGDVTPTNAVQSWVDPISDLGWSRAFYQAVLVE